MTVWCLYGCCFASIGTEEASNYSSKSHFCCSCFCPQYQAHSPRGGDGRDTDSDSWNDFSLAESDKEGHLSQRLQRSQQQHLVQQHHQNHADAAHGQVSSPRHSTSSLHATSSRGKASAAAGGGGPAVRYPAGTVHNIFKTLGLPGKMDAIFQNTPLQFITSPFILVPLSTTSTA